MDRFSFVASARAKVLVVPIGSLSAEKFDKFFHHIRATNNIRLLDVTPIPECRYFNPQAFPQGSVFYDFTTNLPEEETAFLSDFEPYRKTMVILGVGEYEESLESSISDLRARFPTAIVHNCIFFDSPSKFVESSNLDVYYLSSFADLNITAMETTICSVTRSYLKALDECASSYESMSLRSPVSLIDSNVLTRTINYAQKRISSGSSYKVSFSNGQDMAKSTDLKLKALQRQTGRHSKLMGNFFLLAGKCNDALQYFTDAAINAKKCDDYLWLASALEGLATSAFVLAYLELPFHVQNPMLASLLLVSRSRVLTLGASSSRVSTDSLGTKSNGVVSPRNSTSSTLSFGFSAATLTGTITDFSALTLPEFLKVLCLKASQYYQLSATEIEDCVPDLVYVEAIIRYVKLMVTIYLGASAPLRAILESVVTDTSIELKGSKEGSLVLKSDIIHEIDKVFSLQLVDLDFTEQCHVYCALASIYSDLKLYRKQAFILRILLVALLPKVSRMEKSDTVADINSIASITRIFLLLFQVYRIDLEPERNESMAKEHVSDWSTLQILVIKICLRIAESLQDYKTLAKLCVLASTRYSHCLLSEDQVKLKDKLNWLNLLLGSKDADDTLPYPDPFMVRNIKFVVAPSGSDLVPFAEVEQANGSTLSEGAIIFNPFSKSKIPSNKERLICVNEMHQLKVTLQNPFPYDVELDEIAVASDDNVRVETIKSLTRKISSNPLVQRSDVNPNNGMNSSFRKNVATNGGIRPIQNGSVVLQRNSVTQVIVSFKAMNRGQLSIKGLTLKAGNSRSQLFLILDLEKPCGLKKIKDYGTKAPAQDEATLDQLIQNLSKATITDRVFTKELSLSVISRQPSLSVINNLITNGWIMLLEGERQQFSLDLKNTSPDPVNYLSFSFWDSTSDFINAKLAQSGAYAPEDVYELEWLLLKNRPFQVLNKQELATDHKVIRPNDEFKIDYEINGKRGMTELKLILEYSNKKADSPVQSYMKTISVPLNVTVQLSLDIVGCDVIPFFSTSLHGYVAGSHEHGIIQRNMDALLDFIATTKASAEEDISSYALLVLDVKNSWKHKLCANISNEIASRETYVVNEMLDPSETCRFLLPVKRIGHEVIDTSKPIPSLRNKQFIKNYNISKEDEIQERKNFWIKSILLEGLSGRWNTVGLETERYGVLDTRCIRLSTSMTNVLVYDSILIQHTIVADDGLNKEMQKENNEYRLEREQFYVLKTKITNHTHDSLTGTLRHVPFPVNAATKLDLSIDLKILYNGELQMHIGKKSIPQGESLELSLGFLIVEKGRYEWGCVFDVAREKGNRVIGREPVYINAL